MLRERCKQYHRTPQHVQLRPLGRDEPFLGRILKPFLSLVQYSTVPWSMSFLTTIAEIVHISLRICHVRLVLRLCFHGTLQIAHDFSVLTLEFLQIRHKSFRFLPFQICNLVLNSFYFQVATYDFDLSRLFFSCVRIKAVQSS